MRSVIAVGVMLAMSATAQEAKQNAVSTAGAPSQTDAEPGYWTNLFENTMRFTLLHPAGKQDVDVFYNRDKTVSSNVGMKGTWHTEGEAGKEMFCYTLGPFKSEPMEIGECFPLRLMNNPRIGAKWGAKMKQGINYQAVVVAGRATATAVK
ncbi:MAG: hypothetical protein JNM81_07860 [Rhodospirillaceae bacterium]|nr:hypothetical protein [Rhodospirillaceae bacterium]